MATKILNERYAKFDGKSAVPADQLFVEVEYAEKSKKLVPISSLYVKLDTKKTYGARIRKIKSYSDFVAQLKKNNVYTSPNATQRVGQTVEVKHEVIKVPLTLTTISKDKGVEADVLPYGFKRDIAVKETPMFDFEKDIRLLAEVGGKKEYVDPREIYYYNDDNYKIYPKKRADIMSHRDVVYHTKDGRPIDLLYTEKQFIVDKVIASESIDFEHKQKTTYKFIDKLDNDLEEIIKQEIEAQNAGAKPKTNNFEVIYNGSKYKINLDESYNFVHAVKYTTTPIVKYFSEQEYVTFEEKDPNDPKEKITTSMIKVRNFEIKSNGEYYQLMVQGCAKMVKLEDLMDKHGSKIADIRKYVGESIQIKIDKDNILTTDPVTYEQANFTYDTVKTFQEVPEKDQGEATENTYLRLKNGEYVKELEAVQPISFKLADKKEEFDAYVVETKDSTGAIKHVIVGKDYFEKHGDTTDLSLSKAYRIKRCQATDKDCSIIQTTSNGKEIEQCEIVKKTVFCDAVAENALETSCQGVMAAYKEGKYQVNDVYHNGEIQELSARGKRYEYTDETYMPDYADSLGQYKSLKTDNLRIENGKLVGGPKYSIGKGIKNGFKTLGKFFAGTYGIMLMAGIFIPVVGPIIGAVHMAACVAAIPAIPLANVIYGSIKNHKRSKFADKTETNRKHLISNLEAKIQALYERQTTKGVNPYSEARFEDEYSKLVNEIIMLSAASVNNNLIVKDGELSVTPGNANAARAYMLEFNDVAKQLKKVSKKLTKIEGKFNELDAEMKKYGDEELNPPAYLTRRYQKAKEEYDACNREHAELVEKQQNLMNFTGNPVMVEQDMECERLLNLAQHMRTAVYLHAFKDNEVVHEALYGKEGLFDFTDALGKTNAVNAEISAFDLGLSEEEYAGLSSEEKDIAIAKYLDLNVEVFSEMTDKEKAKKIIEIKTADLVIDEEGKIIKRKADKKLIKEFEESEDKVGFIRELEKKKAEKMLARMKFDTKRGITIDGRPVDMNDEAISRSPADETGYHWAKVKQAVEFVHNGIKKGESTFEVRVDPIETGEPALQPDDGGEVVGPVVEPSVEPEPTATTPRKRRLKPEVIAAEQAVAIALEEKEVNALYKKLMSSLTRKNGKYKMDKKEAVQFIFDFASKINNAHDQNMYAKDFFEKDSIEAAMLKTSLKELAKLATQNYVKE